jgi:hypothetical protein
MSQPAPALSRAGSDPTAAVPMPVPRLNAPRAPAIGTAATVVGDGQCDGAWRGLRLDPRARRDRRRCVVAECLLHDPEQRLRNKPFDTDDLRPQPRASGLAQQATKRRQAPTSARRPAAPQPAAGPSPRAAARDPSGHGSPARACTCADSGFCRSCDRSAARRLRRSAPAPHSAESKTGPAAPDWILPCPCRGPCRGVAAPATQTCKSQSRFRRRVRRCASSDYRGLWQRADRARGWIGVASRA